MMVAIIQGYEIYVGQKLNVGRICLLLRDKKAV